MEDGIGGKLPQPVTCRFVTRLYDVSALSPDTGQHLRRAFDLSLRRVVGCGAAIK